MADPILQAAKNKASARSQAAKDPILARAMAGKTTGQMALDAAKTAALPVTWTLEQLGNRLDATAAAAMNPLTTKFVTGQSEPLDRALFELARAPITGQPPTRPNTLSSLASGQPDQFTKGDAAYESGVMAGLEPWQARTLSFLAPIPVASGLNAVGKGVLLPAAKAVGEADVVRRAPGVKQVLDIFGQSGATLPKAVRRDYQRTLRQAEGEADFLGYTRERSLRGFEKLPEDAQDAITRAIETRTIDQLPDDLQRAARAIGSENRAMVSARESAGLARNELQSENLDYAARILTKEGREARGLKPYGNPVEHPPKPGLATSTGKGRSEAGRVLTAEQMSAGDAAQGRRLFEPVVKGTILKGQSNDAAVMHAKIIGELDRKFGRAIQAGDTPISELRGVPTGFTDARKAELAKRALPKEIHAELERLNKTFQPDEWGKAKQAIQVINQEFRRWALFSPGFLSRNMQNNLVQNVIAGNANPATWGKAVALRTRFQRGKETAADLPYIKELIENGVIGKGQTALDIPKGFKGRIGQAFDKWRDANQVAEDVSRMALYDYFKSTGLNPVEAAERVNTWLFNYSPTFRSAQFQSLRKNVFPFINWRSQVPGLFVRSALERPGSLGMAGNVRNQLNAQMPEGADENLPEWAKRGGATYNPLTKNFVLPQALGQMDFDEIADNLRRGPEGLARLGVTNAYPQFGVAAAEGAGKNFFLNRQFKYPGGKDQLTVAPAVFKFAAMSPKGRAILEEHGFRINEDGSVLAPVRVATWLNAFPQLRLANIAADLIKPDPQSEFRIRSFLAGVREVNPQPQSNNAKR